MLLLLPFGFIQRCKDLTTAKIYSVTTRLLAFVIVCNRLQTFMYLFFNKKTDLSY